MSFYPIHDQLYSHQIFSIPDTPDVLTKEGGMAHIPYLMGVTKDDLFIRLLNVGKNREELNDAIFRTIGDIALVLYARMGELDGCSTSVKIKRHIFEKWNKDEQMTFNDALLNTYFISPPRIYCWEKLICNMMQWSGVTEQELALTSIETVSAFAKLHHADLTVIPGGEHWFHTDEQMQFLDKWIRDRSLNDVCG